MNNGHVKITKTWRAVVRRILPSHFAAGTLD